MLYYRAQLPPCSEFSQNELLLFDDKHRVKTHNLLVSETANRVESVKTFLYKVHIICSECPPPTEAAAHAFRCLWISLIALLIAVCGKSSEICCSTLFSSGMFLGFEWSLWNVWSIAAHTSAWIEVWWIWWPFVLCDKVDTVGPQPCSPSCVWHWQAVHVSWSAVLMEYESRWKQPLQSSTSIDFR